MAPNCVRIRSTSLFCLVPFTKLLEDLYFSFWASAVVRSFCFNLFTDTFRRVSARSSRRNGKCTRLITRLKIRGSNVRSMREFWKKQRVPLVNRYFIYDMVLYHVIFVYYIYRVRPNDMYKRARGDSLWKNKEKIWIRYFWRLSLRENRVLFNIYNV